MLSTIEAGSALHQATANDVAHILEGMGRMQEELRSVRQGQEETGGRRRRGAGGDGEQEETGGRRRRGAGGDGGQETMLRIKRNSRKESTPLEEEEMSSHIGSKRR